MAKAISYEEAVNIKLKTLPGECPTVKEVCALYFSESTKSSTNVKWFLDHLKELPVYEKLEKDGYKEGNRFFSSYQTILVIMQLGEPHRALREIERLNKLKAQARGTLL